MFFNTKDEKEVLCPICSMKNIYSESEVQLNNSDLYGNIRLKCSKCLFPIEIKIEKTDMRI